MSPPKYTPEEITEQAFFLEKLESEVTKISSAVEDLLSSGMNRDLLVRAIKQASGSNIRMDVIDAVLDGIAGLAEYCFPSGE